MRKAFIDLSILLAIGAIILVGALYFKTSQPQPARFSHDEKLGTATASGNFPTSLNNFQDGDVINAGDWNNIESTLGITGSAVASSLTYKLTNTASTDPGHKHTTSTITGIFGVVSGGTGTSTFPTSGFVFANGTSPFTVTNPIPIANGGTATTTLTANNVILGNGTSPVQFVAPGASGNILTSNGTTWISSSASPKTLLTALIENNQLNGQTRDYTFPGPNLSSVTMGTMFRLPFAATAKNLYVAATTNTVNGNCTWTLFKNNSATALVATTTASGLTATNTVNTVSVSAGDFLDIEIVCAGSSGTLTNPYNVSLEVDPT